MPRRTETNCDEVCQEHSGIKTMITVVMVGVACTIMLQAYNTFVATAQIQAAIAGIQSDMNNMKEKVSKLEQTVYRK